MEVTPTMAEFLKSHSGQCVKKGFPHNVYVYNDDNNVDQEVFDAFGIKVNVLAEEYNGDCVTKKVEVSCVQADAFEVALSVIYLLQRSNMSKELKEIRTHMAWTPKKG